ncbi:MAG: DUF547 domain-containing protein [Sediminibacterium magnilacihabitans]|jgi:hypothetical protein|nr:DUF547 domain-containing protein [Sediminibacterium magnilacihabitans]
MKREYRRIFKKWLLYFLFLSIVYISSGFVSIIPISKINREAMPDTSLLKLSERLLYNVKTEEPTADIEKELSSVDKKRIVEGLNNDKAIKTFWVNIYNAWFQILAVREKKKNPEIFTSKLILIAGRKFSLDDIEHGILRKFRWKYSKGYLPKFFSGKLIKQLAVSKIDYRIHFALNCGAKSCPPIAFYSYDNIDRQLDMATKSFLSGETEIDDAKREVRVTKIMDWFIADFGGKKGIRGIIKEVMQKDVAEYSIKFKPYNWDEALHNFEK